MLSLFVLGCIVGLFAGLIPGVGVFTALILLYPLLIDLSIQELLVLYIPIASISQFIGSVPALFFKIPGEPTSFIATEYGHKLFHNGHHDLIPLTAIGSFVATILSAQCTDERVNKVTSKLFLKFNKPRDFIHLTVKQIGEKIVNMMVVMLKLYRFG